MNWAVIRTKCVNISLVDGILITWHLQKKHDSKSVVNEMLCLSALIEAAFISILVLEEKTLSVKAKATEHIFYKCYMKKKPGQDWESCCVLFLHCLEASWFRLTLTALFCSSLELESRNMYYPRQHYICQTYSLAPILKAFSLVMNSKA